MFKLLLKKKKTLREGETSLGAPVFEAGGLICLQGKWCLCGSSLRGYANVNVLLVVNTNRLGSWQETEAAGQNGGAEEQSLLETRKLNAVNPVFCM